MVGTTVCVCVVVWCVVVGGGGGGGVEVVVTAVVAAVVVVTTAPPLERVVDLWTTVLRFLMTLRFLCVVLVLVVLVDLVVAVFALLAAGVVDPPDPHPAIRTAVAVAERRIRFMGSPAARWTGSRRR